MLRKCLMAVSGFAVTAGVLWAWFPGRVTGGPNVSVITPSGTTVVTSGFELYCQPEGTPDFHPVFGPNNLEVNWDSGNHWHMKQLEFSFCTSDGQSPAPPPNTAAGGDTITLQGVGDCNGVDGIYGLFTFVDHGEPGKETDLASFMITGDGGACPSLNTGAPQLISGGNVQFHQLQPNP